MKNLTLRLILGLGLASGISLAAVDIAGIIETGNVSVYMDSIVWYLTSTPAPVLETTPGWGGPAGTTDTLQLEQKSEWPQWAELFYRVNGIPNSMTINPILPDTWYDLATYDLQGSKVRFEDTVFPQGINTPRYGYNFTGFTITPNPVTGGRTQVNLPFESVNSPSFKIYDINGEEVRSGTPPSSPKFELNLSGLAKGVYLIRIRAEGLELKEKILILD